MNKRIKPTLILVTKKIVKWHIREVYTTVVNKFYTSENGQKIKRKFNSIL